MGMSSYFNEVDNWFKDRKHEAVTKCIICGEKTKNEVDITGRNVCQSYIHVAKDLDIDKCPNCGFVWRWFQPTQETLCEFYSDSKPIKSWAKIKSGEDESTRQIEKYHYVWEFIKRNDIKSILDVGCGNGYFLNNVDSSRVRVGIEMSESAKAHCNFPVYNNRDIFSVSTHSAKEYDMITMFGVLEHLKDPVEQLQFYTKYLKNGGIFCAIVPNHDSLIVQTLGTECSTFCPQHLWYFNPTTLAMLTEKIGLYLNKYITVESEIQPILRKLRGFNPYLKIGFDLTDRDITSEKILENGLGYKIIAFFTKGELCGQNDCHNTM